MPFRIMVGAVIVLRHLWLPLLPAMFHCFFQLKMVEPKVFYFTGHPDCQFLKDVPSSHKGWKCLYFFAHLPTPLPHSEVWHTKLPELPNLQESRSCCPFSSTLYTLRDHPYSIRTLLDNRLLAHFKLSPFIPNDPTLIGSSPIVYYMPRVVYIY